MLYCPFTWKFILWSQHTNTQKTIHYNTFNMENTGKIIITSHIIIQSLRSTVWPCTEPTSVWCCIFLQWAVRSCHRTVVIATLTFYEGRTEEKHNSSQINSHIIKCMHASTHTNSCIDLSPVCKHISCLNLLLQSWPEYIEYFYSFKVKEQHAL